MKREGDSEGTAAAPGHRPRSAGSTPAGAAEESARPRSYGGRRAFALLAVHALILLHFLHWRWNGTTLAPLELNEAVYTFELGVVTAGFLMFAVLALATLVFGRFFCSWGCHVLALEDLCAWILAKLRIRPKPVRSRLLLWVPALTAGYMFVWPQIARLARGDPAPPLRLASDDSGWASFLTSDFTRNLPGPAVAIVTLIVCGFLVVYALGSRSFCTYVCPYGAVFALADRVAPGRIVAKGDCSDCARCTAACQSGILVHEELRKFGTVVNPSCLRDLDCVAACPSGHARFGFVTPPLVRGKLGFARLRRTFDFDWREELLLAGVLIASIFALRGLYDTISFFLTLAVGVMLAYSAVLARRAWLRADVRWNAVQIKRRGAVTPHGRAYLACTGALFVLLAHSGWIRWNETRGRADLQEARSLLARGDPSAARYVQSASERLGRCEAWSLYLSPSMEHDLALAAELAGDSRRCAALLQRAYRRSPHDLVIAQSYAQSLANAGRWELAASVLSERLAALPEYEYARPSVRSFRIQAAVLLGTSEAMTGRAEAARHAYELALALDPHARAAHQGLGQVLASTGELARAAEHLALALRGAPDDAATLYNLACVELGLGRKAEALARLEACERLRPGDVDVLNNLGWARLDRGELTEAERALQRAVELAPGHAAAQFNLGRVLEARGAHAEARACFDRARALDPRYAAGAR